jgi:hypothetical protein
VENSDCAGCPFGWNMIVRFRIKEYRRDHHEGGGRGFTTAFLE